MFLFNYCRYQLKQQLQEDKTSKSVPVTPVSAMGKIPLSKRHSLTTAGSSPILASHKLPIPGGSPSLAKPVSVDSPMSGRQGMTMPPPMQKSTPLQRGLKQWNKEENCFSPPCGDSFFDADDDALPSTLQSFKNTVKPTISPAISSLHSTTQNKKSFTNIGESNNYSFANDTSDLGAGDNSMGSKPFTFKYNIGSDARPSSTSYNAGGNASYMSSISYNAGGDEGSFMNYSQEDSVMSEPSLSQRISSQISGGFKKPSPTKSQTPTRSSSTQRKVSPKSLASGRENLLCIIIKYPLYYWNAFLIPSSSQPFLQLSSH